MKCVFFYLQSPINESDKLYEELKKIQKMKVDLGAGQTKFLPASAPERRARILIKTKGEEMTASGVRRACEFSWHDRLILCCM